MKNRVVLNKFFSRDRKALYIVLGIVMISVLTLSVVYAALSTTLNINGNAEVTAASWDIYLDNVQLNSNSATSNVPTITDARTATFSTTLSKPGDFYEFTVDVVNNGSINAMIDSVTKTPELTTTQAKYLNYVIEYQNGESINTKQLVSKDSFVRLKVKVEFRKDISASDLPITSETLDLSFKVNYVQSDDSDENVTIDNNGKLIKVVSGDLETVGSEICIGEECFYVISSDENSVTMFAKYNLYVGNECTTSSSSSCTPYGDEATGLQNSEMIACGASPRKGTVAFSSNEKKGKNYSDYDGSIVEEYINNYKYLLEKLDIAIEMARLITKDELEMLGCDFSNNICNSAPKWVYATSYWTGTPIDVNYIITVFSDSGFGDDHYSYDFGVGVRPVIKILKSEF